MYSEGFAFDVYATPTVTAGAYSAGDIMGALMTFQNVAPNAGGIVILQDVQIDCKADVAPALTLIIFDEDPAATTKTDNAAYSLHDDDLFKVKVALPFADYAVVNVDHGGSRSIRIGNLAIPLRLKAGSTSLYALLVDGTGVTLASTSDLKVSLRGVGP